MNLFNVKIHICTFSWYFAAQICHTVFNQPPLFFWIISNFGQCKKMTMNLTINICLLMLLLSLEEFLSPVKCMVFKTLPHATVLWKDSTNLYTPLNKEITYHLLPTLQSYTPSFFPLPFSSSLSCTEQKLCSLSLLRLTPASLLCPCLSTHLSGQLV